MLGSGERWNPRDSVICTVEGMVMNALTGERGALPQCPRAEGSRRHSGWSKDRRRLLVWNASDELPFEGLINHRNVSI